MYCSISGGHGDKYGPDVGIYRFLLQHSAERRVFCLRLPAELSIMRPAEPQRAADLPQDSVAMAARQLVASWRTNWMESTTTSRWGSALQL